MSAFLTTPEGVTKSAGLLQRVVKHARAQLTGDAVLIGTDVLLPNGLAIVLTVEGGAQGNRFVVSDVGAALAVLSDSGLPSGKNVIAAANRAALSRNLRLEGAAVVSPHVEADDIPATIKWVADGSRRVAEAAIAEARRKERRLLRQRVEGDLQTIFQDATIRLRGVLRGRSNDAHKFDFLVRGLSGFQLALDAPTPDASSIAAVIVRHLDVKAAGIAGLRQVIAYDDADTWPSKSLDQLRLSGVPLVAAQELRHLPNRIGLPIRS